ncbi:MAG: hypothetical protein ACI3YC_03345 [Alloprevotella sp.]
MKHSESSSEQSWRRLLPDLRHYPFTLGCVVLIWYLCLFRPPSVPSLSEIPNLDKVVHTVMYLGTFGVMWIEYSRRHSAISLRRLLLLGIVVPIAMSGVIELVQEYCTTWRGGDILDFLANSLGVLLAACFGKFLLWRKARIPVR